MDKSSTPCELIFHAIRPDDAAAGPDELVLLPAAADQRQRRDLARLALEKGPEAFLRGDGPIRRIVLPAFPTLDHLLAAEFLGRQLAMKTGTGTATSSGSEQTAIQRVAEPVPVFIGQPLPAGAAKMAECARLIREGLRPGEVPPERSPEAIFLAIVNGAGEDLTKPETAEKFCRDWSRMARRLMQAAEEGKDPFVTPLFDDAEFARERAFLARDQEVYRHDVARGQRWLVRVPGGPPRAAALLLRQPKSLLFKHWARSDASAPAGGGYLFLAVQWSEREWVFSTDPVQRISIKPLAEELEAAEGAANPSQAAADPWFDGKPFDHTLVSSPHRGTSLGEPQVLRIVKRWTRARPVDARKSRAAMIAAAALAALVAIAVGYRYLPAIRRPAAPMDDSDRQARRGMDFEPASEPVKKPNLYVLTVGVSNYNLSTTGYAKLGSAANDARDLAEALRLAAAGAFEKPVVPESVIDADATKSNILRRIRQLRDRCTQNDIAVIALSGHGDIDQTTNGQFFFVPFDFDRKKEKCDAGVTRSDLEKYIETFPCTVVVILDTCHSGNALATDKARGGDNLEEEVDTCMSNLRRAGKGGVIVLAGCLASGTSGEDAENGYLTRAILELLRGTPEADPELKWTRKPGDLLRFSDLNAYVTDRVPKLRKGQSVIVHNSGVGLGDVPLGVFREGPTAAK